MNEETVSQKTATPVQSHYDVLEQALVRRVNDQVDRVESELDLLKQVIADLIERRPSGQRRPADATTSLTEYARQLSGRVPVQARPVDPIVSSPEEPGPSEFLDRTSGYGLVEPEPVTCTEIDDSDVSDETDYIDVESESLAPEAQSPELPKSELEPGHSESTAQLSLSADAPITPAPDEWVDTVEFSAPADAARFAARSADLADDDALLPPPGAASLAALEAPTGDALNLAPPSPATDEWFVESDAANQGFDDVSVGEDLAEPLVDPQAISVTESAEPVVSAPTVCEPGDEAEQDCGSDQTFEGSVAVSETADTCDSKLMDAAANDAIDGSSDRHESVSDHSSCEDNSGPVGLTSCSHDKTVAPSSAQCAWAAEVGAAVMRVANQSRNIPESASEPGVLGAEETSGVEGDAGSGKPETSAAVSSEETAANTPEASAEAGSLDAATAGPEADNTAQADNPAQCESPADRLDSDPAASTEVQDKHRTDEQVQDDIAATPESKSDSATAPVLLSGVSSAKALAATTEVLTGKNEGVFGHQTAHTLVPVEKPLASDATPTARWSHRLEHTWRAAGFRCTVDCCSRAEARAAGLHAVSLAYRSGLKAVVVAATKEWQRWWVTEIEATLPDAHVQICDGNPHVLSAADVTVLCADDKIVSQVCANSGLDVCLITQDVYDYGADAQQDVLTAPTTWRLALVHGSQDPCDVLGRAVQRYFGGECVAVDSDLAAAAALARPFSVFRASVEVPSWEAQEYASLQIEMTRSRERLYRMGADPDNLGSFASTLHHWLVGHGGEQAQARAEEYVAARSACARYTADSTVKVEALVQQADLFAAQGRTLVYSDKLRPSERVAAAVNNSGGLARALPASRFGFLTEQVDVAVLLSPGATTRDFFRRIAAVREPSHTTAPAQVVVVHLAHTHEQDGIEDQGWAELLRCAGDVSEGSLDDIAQWLES